MDHVQTVTVPTRTVDGRTNTYAAHLMPWRSATGNLVVSISNNAWQMDPLAFDNPTLYQPRLFELAAPPGLPVTAQIAASTEPLGFVPTSPPIRAIDTRHAARLAGGHVLHVDLAGIVPDDARAAVIDLAAVDPASERLPDGVVVRRADAGDIEPQLPRRRRPGPRTPSSRWPPTPRSACSAWSPPMCSSTSPAATRPIRGAAVPSAGPDADLRLARHWRHLARRRDPGHRGARRRPGRGDQRDDHRSGGDRLRHRVPVPGGACRWCRTSTTWPGQVVANLVQTGVSNGTICVHSLARTHVVIDLQGTYDTQVDGLRYQAVTPTRLVDTRAGVGSVFGRVAMDAGALGVLPSNGAGGDDGACPATCKALMVSMIAVAPRTLGLGRDRAVRRAGCEHAVPLVDAQLRRRRRRGQPGHHADSGRQRRRHVHLRHLTRLPRRRSHRLVRLAAHVRPALGRDQHAW